MNEAEQERLRLEATIERLLRATVPGGPLTSTTGKPLSRRSTSPEAALRTIAVLAGILATLVTVLVVLRRAPFFFLVIVILLATGGAWAWWMAALKEREDDVGPDGLSPASSDLELAKTEAAIAKLRESIGRAPSAVQTFAPDAERALAAISRGARALAYRSRSLTTVLEGLGSGRIEKEHAELLSRLISTSEPEAHRLLEQAIASSERKRQRVRELRTYAERVAAERLRIRHTLEATHLDIERAIAADLPPIQEEAAWSLRRLTDEISAIAEALERHASLAPEPPGDAPKEG